MMALSGIVLLTFRELWAKKVVIGLFVVSTLVLLMTAFALNLDVVEGSLAGIRLFGQETELNVQTEEGGTTTPLTLETIVVGVQSAVAGAAYWIGTLLALFATAPLFTSMLEAGHIDLLLAKPFSRTQLFLGHVAGVWLTMLVLALYLLGGIWLIMSIKTGIWRPSFLASIVIVMAMFAVMYGVVMLMGVWTQSTALALIASYGLIFVSLFLAAGDTLAQQLAPFSRGLFWTLYYVLPNFAEVTQAVARLARAEPIGVWTPLLSSLGFGVVVYGASIIWFGRRDF